ncbi:MULTISPECIES: hypothetical protein [unclassified Frankia]|uniref:hypothetical protein n=1 Tax=unclassified Frankia TaxID=2632575 RepID=UPI002AD276E8|nr:MULTISPECIES: hypothetical protein [unclassified Frankia]
MPRRSSCDEGGPAAAWLFNVVGDLDGSQTYSAAVGEEFVEAAEPVNLYETRFCRNY